MRRSALLLLSLVAPAAVQAQQQDPSRTDTLAPITVQATRGDRPWLDVPLAVTRVDSRELFGRSGYGLNDALSHVPGVIAQSRYGGSDVRLVIRGSGARGAGDRSNAGTSRGVRLLLDGVPETEPDGRTAFDHVDLANITDIQVIRSNASAVWGNAAGGVVMLSTLDMARPRLGAAELQVGSYGLRRVIVRSGGALAAGAIAASLVRTDYDGYRAHSGGSRWTGTLSLRTALGDRTSLGLFGVATDNLFYIPGPLTRAEADATPAAANATYAARDERRHNRLGRLAVTLDHDFGRGLSIGGLAFASPKFLQRSERGTFRDFTRYHVGGNLLARHQHRLGANTWGRLTAGVDEAWQDGAVLFYSLSATNTRGDTLRNNQREGANNFGVFVQEELDLGERVSLSLGVRHDAITYHSEDFMNPALAAERTFSRVTPKVGATFRLSRRHSLYASVGGGVEVPAGNETDPASTFGQDTVTSLNPLLNPIRSTTYEAGTKYLAVLGDGFLRRVMYDVAVYTTGVSDDIVPYRGGRFYFTAGRTRRSGVEIGTRFETRPGISLTTALTYSRNRYDDYQVDSVHYGVPGAIADYSGNKAVGVPDVIYDVGLGYSRPALPLSFRLNLQGTSSYFADDANTVTVDGYTVVNATVGLERPLALGRTFGLRGFVSVNNLLGARYLASAFLNPDLVGGVPVAFEPGLPRNFVVSLSLVRL